MDTTDKIRFIQSTMEPMAWHTYSHIAKVIAIVDTASGRHVGCALRCLIAGRRALVTTTHVVHLARKSGRFAVTAALGEALFELYGDPDRIDNGRDVAVYFLPDEYPPEGIAFWPEDRIDPTEDGLATDYLFLHGFPQRRTRLTPLLSGLVGQSFPYGAMMRVDRLPADIKPYQLAIDFDPSGMFPQEGTDADWLDPHGLVGSPIWRIGATGRRVDTWKPELSLLVGIVTKWCPAEKLILATKVASVLDLLHK